MSLRAELLSFAYAPDRAVLREVNASALPGTMTAILGPNGAGKSTLLRLLLGLLSPASGRVLLDDRPLSALPRHELATRLAYVPQRPDVAFSFSVEAVVAMGRYAQDRVASDGSVRRALERMELADRASDPFETLSAGQQQRVALARALAQLDSTSQATRVLLADEPVSAMDPRHAMQAMRVMRELCATETAVVVVLHDLALASRFCDRAILLGEEGRVLAAGPIAEVLQRETLRAAFHLDFACLPDPAPHSTSNLWLALPDRM